MGLTISAHEIDEWLLVKTTYRGDVHRFRFVKKSQEFVKNS
jgi:hypothetical protein